MEIAIEGKLSLTAGIKAEEEKQIPVSMIQATSSLVSLVLDKWTESEVEQKFIPTVKDADVESLFNEYAFAWKEETGMYSTLDEKTNNPNYIKIKKMGRKVIPYLLKDLKQEPEHWFEILEYITRENPVLPKHIGNMKKMAKDWLKWGKREGY